MAEEAPTCNPSAGEKETGRVLKFVGQLTQSKSKLPESMRDPVSKNKVRVEGQLSSESCTLFLERNQVQFLVPVS